MSGSSPERANFAEGDVVRNHHVGADGSGQAVLERERGGGRPGRDTDLGEDVGEVTGDMHNTAADETLRVASDYLEVVVTIA